MTRKKLLNIFIRVFIFLAIGYLIGHVIYFWQSQSKTHRIERETMEISQEQIQWENQQKEMADEERAKEKKVADAKKALSEKLAKEGKTAYFLGDVDHLSDAEIAKLFRYEKSQGFNLTIEAYRVFSVRGSYVTGPTDGCLEECLSFSPRTPEQIRDLIDQIESGGVIINLLDKKFGGLENMVEKDCRKEGSYGSGWFEWLEKPVPKDGFSSPRTPTLKEGEHFIISENEVEALGSAIIKKVSDVEFFFSYGDDNDSVKGEEVHPRYIVEWNKGCGEWLGLCLKTKTGFQLRYPAAFGDAKIIDVWLPYSFLTDEELEKQQVAAVFSNYTNESWEEVENFLRHPFSYGVSVIYDQKPIVPCQVINGEARVVRNAWDDNWGDWEEEKDKLAEKYRYISANTE